MSEDTQYAENNQVAPEGQVEDVQTETPQEQDPVAKMKELEQKLSEANTQRATLEARYQELANVQQTQMAPQQTAAPSLDERLDKVVDGFVEDPQTAKAELANIIQETKDDASYNTTALVQGLLAMNQVKASKPHLAPFETVLNQKAQELMYDNPRLTYDQALSQSADQFDGLIQKANESRGNQGQGNVQQPVQAPQPAGTGGMMRQAPPPTPVQPQEVLAPEQELSNKNRALTDKYRVKAR